MRPSWLVCWLLTCCFLSLGWAAETPFQVQLRSRVESSTMPGLFQLQTRSEQWEPAATAIIVCDMWDKHWCRGATERVVEIAPHMQKFLSNARERGVLIIHAPSSCMKPYENSTARARTLHAPSAMDLPKDISSWCKVIPSEEKGIYPLDQSDGGCDCRPKCKTYNAWTKQYDTLAIEANDAVSDSGVEIWNLLTARGIKNVMLVGVHTNMCVLGRPFGLRQLAKNGKNVVLVRDLTDTMYNHASWPYVNHFRGNQLIVEHIEKYVAPTISSEQLLGGEPFRFQGAKQPHVLFMIGEDEYDTKRTLPAFAREELEPWGVRCTFIHADEKDPNRFPHLNALEQADLLVLSVRRRTPPEEQLAQVRKHLAAGKPLVGIRTASHAFSLRNNAPAPENHATWLDFDSTVLGGNYRGHYGSPNANGPNGKIKLLETMKKHPLLAGISNTTFDTKGSIYKNEPLRPNTTLLMTGVAANETTVEPIAWTHQLGESRIAYTSLGHPGDFDQPEFRKWLSNAIHWAMEK